MSDDRRGPDVEAEVPEETPRAPELTREGRGGHPQEDVERAVKPPPETR